MQPVAGYSRPRWRRRLLLLLLNAAAGSLGMVLCVYRERPAACARHQNVGLCWAVDEQ